MSNLVFYADAVDGKLTIHKKKLFDKYVASLKGLVSIEIKKRRAKRSLNQNAYYWKILEIIGDEYGIEKEELHDYFGAEYRSIKKVLTNKVTGEIFELDFIRSTSSMNKIEFGEYLDKVIAWAANMGIIILSPEEYLNQPLQ